MNHVNYQDSKQFIIPCPFCVVAVCAVWGSAGVGTRPGDSTLDGSASTANNDATSASAAPDSDDGGIPFYVIAGALLLLSIIPAHYLKQRGTKQA